MKKEIKQLLPIIILIIIILAIPLGVYLVRQQQQLRSKALEGRANLEFSPNLQDVSLGSPLNVALQINSGYENRVSAVDVEIAYSAQLALRDFEPDFNSGLDKIVISDIDPSTRTLRFVAANTTGTVPFKRLVTIGTLRFDTVREGRAEIGAASADKIIVTASGQEQPLIVDSSQKGIYAINLVLSPTPTATPIPSGPLPPTGSPTPTQPPTVTPTKAPVRGDANGDFCVDRRDYDIWLSEYTGRTSTKKADFDKNGKVGPEDYAIWLEEFNSGTNVCTGT